MNPQILPIYYRIQCSQCTNRQIEFKLMDEQEKQTFKCAVCSYKTVGISGHIIANIYVKCSLCKCIFYNKFDYIGDKIKCQMDTKQSKQCDVCESVRNDVILRWDGRGGIFLCCNECEKN